MEESSELLPRTCGGLCLGVHYAHSTEPDIWPDGCLVEEAAQDLLLPDHSHLRHLSHLSPLPSAPSPPLRLLPAAFEAAPPPPRLPVPIRELPPRRKVVWIWICCCCGHGGMKVSVDPCPHCGIPRCPTCHTQRYNIRGSDEYPEPEDENEIRNWFWRLALETCLGSQKYVTFWGWGSLDENGTEQPLVLADFGY